MTDLTMEEIVKLSWDAMNEEERKLHTDVQHIKRMCMSRVESLFVQHYHDAGIDDLPKLVEKCNTTRDIDFFIEDIIYNLVYPVLKDKEDREKMKRSCDVE